MSRMRFVVLGVGDAFSARYYSSCLALESDGSWLLIDCPHPIRKMMREASATAGIELDVDRVVAVALTHLHADHCSGLEGFAYYNHYVVRRKTELLAHPLVSEHLWEGHLSAGMSRSQKQPGEPAETRCLDDFFHLRSLHEGQSVSAGPFTIDCRPTIHSVPTTALLVRWSGRCFGYSADTAYDPGLIEWLSAADLIVHEAGLGGMHSPYAKLVELPADLRARMRLIHYPDSFDLTTSAIEPLRPGRCYLV